MIRSIRLDKTSPDTKLKMEQAGLVPGRGGGGGLVVAFLREVMGSILKQTFVRRYRIQ